jgi:hypothetical protein
MAKHQSGPWIVDTEGNRILACDPRATIICHMSATTRNPEVMADARLIAAAPDLLAALIEAEKIVAEHYKHTHELVTHMKICAAIASATGDSHD